MKKEFEAPEIIVVEFATEDIMDESGNPEGGSEWGGTGDLD